MSKFISLFSAIILLFSQNIYAQNETVFQPFTGKVLGNKVRLRIEPNLDCQIVKNLVKDDLLLVVGEEAEFWKIQPPHGSKAYVFRSFILDDKVEVNRVNIRLEPNLDSPVIGQFQKGDHVTGKVADLDNKWLEITPPNNIGYYIAKEADNKM